MSCVLLTSSILFVNISSSFQVDSIPPSTLSATSSEELNNSLYMDSTASWYSSSLISSVESFKEEDIVSPTATRLLSSIPPAGIWNGVDAGEVTSLETICFTASIDVSIEVDEAESTASLLYSWVLLSNLDTSTTSLPSLPTAKSVFVELDAESTTVSPLASGFQVTVSVFIGVKSCVDASIWLDDRSPSSTSKPRPLAIES
mmetsp:Transcript_6992/g.14400  ORF Transcript_6992/g.14400 Transcript_6992/m.14400 type:complete len:202 (-) Transcript_6992:1358-1963(-)